MESNESAAEFGCEDGSLLDRPAVRFTVITAYIAIFLLCLLGNLFTFVVICVHRSMRTATNFFLANLAVADLLVAVFCILQNMFHIVGMDGGHWPLGETFCKLYVTVLHLVPCIGVGILVCVSLEKYVAVLHPLLALKVLTPKLRVCLIIAIWVGSITINLPYYFTTVERRYNQFAACTRDMAEYDVIFTTISIRGIIAISFVLWYCVPLGIIAFIYSRVGMVLWKSSMKPLAAIPASLCNQETMTSLPNLANRNGEVESLDLTEASQRDEGNNGVANGGDVLESRKKIIRLLIAIVTSFALLTLPHHARLLHVMFSTDHECNSQWTSLLQPVTYLLLFLSSSVNPILYAFMSQRFRSAVSDIMQCRGRGRMRKYTRTRTILSEMNENPSRSPSPPLNNNNNNSRVTCM